MDVRTTDRGFPVIEHPQYGGSRGRPVQMLRLVQQSSAVGEYDDAFERPGTSFLWIGAHHHLNREEVAQLVKHLRGWLKTGSLVLNKKGGA